MKSRTRSFWACVLVVAFSVMILFPGNLWGSFLDKEDLKTAGIIAGITLGVGLAIVLIAGAAYDLKKIFKKDSAWLSDPDAMKLFSGAGAPSGNGAIYFEGTEITGKESGPDIDFFTGQAHREGRLMMPPLSTLRDPILLRPRFEPEFEAASTLSIDCRNQAVAMGGETPPPPQDR